MALPPLVIEARKHIGQREIPGMKSNPWIIGLWYNAAPWLAQGKPAEDGTTPWCGAFARFLAVTCGYAPAKKWWSARDWLNWGVPVEFPCVGAFAIYDRPGGAHITLIAGQYDNGDLCGIGGNQGDAVCEARFPRSRKPAGYRLPPGTAVPALALLPMVAKAGASVSAREA